MFRLVVVLCHLVFVVFARCLVRLVRGLLASASKGVAKLAVVVVWNTIHTISPAVK